MGARSGSVATGDRRAEGGLAHRQGGLEIVLLGRAAPYWGLLCGGLLDGGKREVPRELVSLSLARSMQREYVRAEQHEHAKTAKPVDAFGQCGMLSLGGVQVRQDYNCQALPRRLAQQPERQGVGDPRCPLVE